MAKTPNIKNVERRLREVESSLPKPEVLSKTLEGLTNELEENSQKLSELKQGQKATALQVNKNERQLKLSKTKYVTQEQVAGLPQNEDYARLSQRVETIEQRPAAQPVQVPGDKKYTPEEEGKLSQVIEDAEKSMDNKCEILYTGLDKAEQRVEALEPRTRELKRLVEGTIPNFLEKKVGEVEKAAGAAQEAQEQLEKQAEKYQRELGKLVRQAEKMHEEAEDRICGILNKRDSWPVKMASKAGWKFYLPAAATILAIGANAGDIFTTEHTEYGCHVDDNNKPDTVHYKKFLGVWPEWVSGVTHDNGDYEPAGDRIKKIVNNPNNWRSARNYHARKR